MKSLLLLCLLPFVASFGSPVQEAGNEEQPPTLPALQFGPEQAWLSLGVRLEVTNDFLEFLLVNMHGGVHESLFSTDVEAEVLNTALLTLGVAPGQNARWEAIDPEQGELTGVGQSGPRQAGQVAGRDRYRVVPPQGDGLYLYAAWKEGDETFFFRIEDLVRDLDRGRTLRRHALVYLGSFFSNGKPEEPPRFAAAVEGNLIYLSLLKRGAALITTAVPECDKQSNWLANSWLLPERGSSMRLVVSRTPLVSMPAEVRAGLPQLPAQEAEPRD
ncbi:MAG: YdjY domain-containing protein [Planctomycetota bacterium]